MGCVPPVYSDFTTAGMLGAPVADTGVEAFTGKDFFNTTKYMGNFREIVVSDTLTGGLDFLYQIQRTAGPDPLGRMTTVDYTPAITDVGICSACADLLAPIGGSHIAPQFVGRSVTGDQLTFDFGGMAATQIGDSNESSILVIKTNITSSAGGSSSIIDGGTANVSSFAPTPEPAFYGLLSLGMAGLFVISFRRRTSEKRTL
jgi:hypothetical protein